MKTIHKNGMENPILYPKTNPNVSKENITWFLKMRTRSLCLFKTWFGTN